MKEFRSFLILLGMALILSYVWAIPPGSWFSVDRPQITEDFCRQQYAGRPIEYRDLPAGEYMIISAQRHELSSGDLFFALVRAESGKFLFVSEIPDELFSHGTIFTIVKKRVRT